MITKDENNAHSLVNPTRRVPSPCQSFIVTLSFNMRHLLDKVVNDVRKAVACLCCLIIVGPLLFLLGIYMTVTAPFDSTREHNIDAMNAAIRNWTHYEPEFASAEFSIYSYAQQKDIPLQLSTSVRSFFCKNGKTHALSYSPTSPRRD